MIVLDTNVISEAMKPLPHPAVRAWLNDQAAETLYLSSVTLAELLFGIAALPAGLLLGQLLYKGHGRYPYGKKVRIYYERNRQWEAIVDPSSS